MPNKNVTKEDESENQLMQTPLQLPFNSHLIIDETKMDCGQLTTLGRFLFNFFSSIDIFSLQRSE
jgi:hypothetical protein